MKIRAILAGLLAVMVFSGCTIQVNGKTVSTNTLEGSGKLVEVTRNVTGFDRVDLGAIGNLTITSGTEESLKIKADDNLVDHITTDVVNGVLKIDMEPNFNFHPTSEIEYELVVKNLSGVTLSGFGNIQADELSGDDLAVKLLGSGDIHIDQLTGKTLDLNINGFGDLSLDEAKVDHAQLNLLGSGNMKINDFEAQDIETTIGGFGSVSINGKVTAQTVKITGSGDYQAEDLESDSASITMSGFGNTGVWVNEQLDVKITGSGDLKYYGNPRISQTISGFGEIQSLGNH